MIRKRLHHVGIIMPTMEKVEAFMKQYQLEEDYRTYVVPYHAHAIFTKPNGNESPIEFLVPTEGVLAEFNNGKGGIHHICYEVDDVEKASKEFRDAGVLMLEDVCPQVDATSKINFVRPKYSHGILVELWEVTEPTQNYLK
jgi:methylmalonyl-CoA/ethylmalonyl-CoA epimerase